MAPSTGLNRKRQVPAQDSRGFGAIAERFRRAGDLERAVALCQEGLAKFPDTLSARVTLGWALLDLGRYDEAREALESALKRAPDNLAAIRGLAELHDRAEHTMHVPMDGASQWPVDPGAVERLEVDPSASTSPADVPLKPEPLSLDTLLSGAKKKGKAKAATPDESVVPELIQSTSHRAHKSEPAAGTPVATSTAKDGGAGVDLNAILNEMDQAMPAAAVVEDTGVELSAEGADADIEKALQLAQAAAEQAAADAAATRKAAEEQSAAEAAARKAAEDNAAKETAARKAAEEKAAAETAARKAAEEKAAAEVAARKAAEEKASEQAAAAKKAAEKAAAEAAAKQAAEQKAAAEAAAKQAAEQKAAAEAAARKAAEERDAVQKSAREAAEKAAAEEKARKAAEEKAAAEVAARKAAEQKAAAEVAARQAAEKAAAEAARQAAEDRVAAEKAAAEAARRAAEDRAAAEAAAKQAAEERAAAEAAARRAAEEKADAEAAAKVAARQAAAEADARRAAEQRAAQETAAREAAERAAQEARPSPHVNGFEVVNGAAEATQPGAVLNLSSPVPVAARTGSPRRALPELESLLRRVESRRAQLMTESVA